MAMVAKSEAECGCVTGAALFVYHVITALLDIPIPNRNSNIREPGADLIAEVQSRLFYILAVPKPYGIAVTGTSPGPNYILRRQPRNPAWRQPVLRHAVQAVVVTPSPAEALPTDLAARDAISRFREEQEQVCVGSGAAPRRRFSAGSAYVPS